MITVRALPRGVLAEPRPFAANAHTTADVAEDLQSYLRAFEAEGYEVVQVVALTDPYEGVVILRSA